MVTSPAVTRAVTDTMARWSAQLAVVAARLAAGSDTGAAELAEMREGLQAATQWLWLADAAVRPAGPPNRRPALIFGCFVPSLRPIGHRGSHQAWVRRCAS